MTELRRWGMFYLCFLVFLRPDATHHLHRDDVCLMDTAITLQLRGFKYSERGSAPRITISIPIKPTSSDLVATLLYHLCHAASTPRPCFFSGNHSLPLRDSNLRANACSHFLRTFCRQQVQNGPHTTSIAVIIPLPTLRVSVCPQSCGCRTTRLSRSSTSTTSTRRFRIPRLPGSFSAASRSLLQLRFQSRLLGNPTRTPRYVTVSMITM